MAFEIGGLERQQGQQVVQEAGDLRRPARPPGPDRRRDIVDQGNSLALEPFGDAKVEIRGIDGHHRRRPQALGGGGGFDDSGENSGNSRQNLRRPHDRQLDHRKLAFHALFFHPCAADTGEGNAVLGLLFKRRHEPGPQHVARRFAGDQKDQRMRVRGGFPRGGPMGKFSMAFGIDADDENPGLVGGLDHLLAVNDKSAAGLDRDATQTGP